MTVIDASALVEFLLRTPRGDRVADAILGGSDQALHAPAVVDLEVLSALRKLELRGLLQPDQTRAALRLRDELRMVRYAHEPLLDRIWSLRRNFTPYDAAYLALAEALKARLITCDSVFERTRHRVRVSLIR